MTRRSLSWVALPSLLLALACTDKATTNSGDNNADTGLDADGDGLTVADGDCNDSDPSVNSAAEEVCDGIDNNCDGTVDEGVTGTYYADNDGDGFGDTTSTTEACEAMDGWVPTDGDCNDANADVYPSALELCDGEDNDCNGTIDDDLESAEWYRDEDGDAYGDPDAAMFACEQPDGYVSNKMDCDDGNSGEPIHVSNRGPVPGSGTEGWDTGDTWGPWDTSDTGSGPLGSRTNPYDNVQDGIDAANTCVYVFPGTYPENIDFNGKNILVFGVSGAHETVIQGTGTGSTVRFDSGETADAQLTGFTITNGGGELTTTNDTVDCGSGATCTTTRYVYQGGCVFISGANPTFTWNLVTRCLLPAYSHEIIDTAGNDQYTESFGGGIYIKNGSPSIENSSLVTNSADIGGGAYVDPTGAPSFYATLFNGNSGSAGGGLATEGSTSLTNVIFVNNTASSAGGGVGGAAINVTGGTLLANFASAVGNDGMGSLYVDVAGNATIANSILVENAGGYAVDGAVGASLAVSYSDVFNSTGGGSYNTSTFADPTGALGNISTNPLFMGWSDDDNYANDDLRLQATSPAVNTASAAYSDPDGSAADMGTYGSAGLWTSP